MNIAILCYHRLGGSGIVAYEIGRAMAEDKGHHVHFIGLEPPFRLKKKRSGHLYFHKVWLKEYPVFDHQPYALALASQLATIIEHCHIDVIHSHYALPHAVSAILARQIAKKKVKCITTLHGTDITIVGAHPSMINITRFAINESDVVTAVSNYLKQETEAILGIEPNRIKTVYNFVNTRNFNPDLKKSKKAKTRNKFILIHASNLRPVKSPLDVIHIFHGLVKAREQQGELWIVGEGPLQYDMIKLAESFSLTDQVKFLGVRSDLGPLLASAHLTLIPSLQESFGLTALESMACGTPVIATRVGGIPEVITDGIDSMLYEKGNTRQAIDHALLLLKDQDRYKKIQQAGLKKASQTFALDKIIDQYESLYKS